MLSDGHIPSNIQLFDGQLCFQFGSEFTDLYPSTSGHNLLISVAMLIVVTY